MIIFYTFIYPNLRLATKGPSCTMGATTPQRLDLRCPVTQQLRTNISVTRRPSERASERVRGRPIYLDLSAQIYRLMHKHTCAEQKQRRRPSIPIVRPTHLSCICAVEGGIGGNLAEENRAAELP